AGSQEKKAARVAKREAKQAEKQARIEAEKEAARLQLMENEKNQVRPLTADERIAKSQQDETVPTGEPQQTELPVIIDDFTQQAYGKGGAAASEGSTTKAA